MDFNKLNKKKRKIKMYRKVYKIFFKYSIPKKCKKDYLKKYLEYSLLKHNQKVNLERLSWSNLLSVVSNNLEDFENFLIKNKRN